MLAETHEESGRSQVLLHIVQQVHHAAVDIGPFSSLYIFWFYLNEKYGTSRGKDTHTCILGAAKHEYRKTNKKKRITIIKE